MRRVFQLHYRHMEVHVKRANTGFTLIELLVIMLMVGLLTLFIGPSFERFLVNNRIAGATNSMLSAISTTRVEAVTVNSCVTLCQTTNPRSATPSCSTGSPAWETGWIMFADSACDRGSTVQPSVSPNRIITIGDPLPPGYSVSDGGGSIRSITFNGRGQMILGAGLSGAFSVTPPAGVGDPSARLICIAMTGRARVINASQAC